MEICICKGEITCARAGCIRACAGGAGGGAGVQHVIYMRGHNNCIPG